MTLNEFFSAIATLSGLLFVVGSMLGTGLSLTVAQTLQPLKNAGLVILAMASLGMAMIVRSLVYIIWGPDQRFYVLGIQRAKQLPFGILHAVEKHFDIVTDVELFTGCELLNRYRAFGLESDVYGNFLFPDGDNLALYDLALAELHDHLFIEGGQILRFTGVNLVLGEFVRLHLAAAKTDEILHRGRRSGLLDYFGRSCFCCGIG